MVIVHVGYYAGFGGEVGGGLEGCHRDGLGRLRDGDSSSVKSSFALIQAELPIW